MIAIVDYGVGNLASIQNMIKKGGNNAVITKSPDIISNAEKILLPGMGHFDNCMMKFKSSGLTEIISQKVLSGNTPVLGICVGLQMFMAESEEGTQKGLGWIDGSTIKFRQADMPTGSKVPNMGWLDVELVKDSSLWKGLENSRFYFAHSYHVKLLDDEDLLLTATYGYKFCVGIQRGNIYGVQFHPEKSHVYGMQLLKNFAEL
ncbi:imidazole glycerol phosphate synthase subunit HisH [Flavihumibacter sediminis]|nr:imidazole glycerol phosphate synthase subunit HisH [Flavihumibacter sediminis]